MKEQSFERLAIGAERGEPTLEDLLETEKEQVLKNSRGLGRLLKKFRDVLPRKAYIVQGLFSIFLATSELAHMSSHLDIFRFNYAQEIARSYDYRGQGGRRLSLEQIPEDLSEKEQIGARIFMNSLTELRAQGFNIKLGQEVLINTSFRNFYGENFIEPPESRAKFSDEVRKKNEEKENFLKEAVKSGDWQGTLETFGQGDTYKFSSVFKQKALIDPKLVPQEDVAAFPIRVYIDQADKNHNVVWAADYSDTKNPVFFTRIYRTDNDADYRNTILELGSQVRGRVSKLDQDTFLAKIPLQEPRGKFVTVVPEDKVDIKKREETKEFFRHWDTVELHIYGLMSGFESLSLKDNRNNEKKTSLVSEEGIPIEVRGRLQLDLYRLLRNQPKPKDWKEKDEFGRFEVKRQVDKYGNEIEYRVGRTPENDNKTTTFSEQITIHMTGIGIKDGEPAQIDFHALPQGLPFLNRSLAPDQIVRRNGFSFVHLDNPDLIKEIPAEKIDAMVAGIKKTEKKFGLKNELIKTIIIFNDEADNAIFIDSESSAISFTGKRIQSSSAEAAELVASHETSHALAHKFGLNEALADTHLRLSEGDFFEQLDEKAFFESIVSINGGHSRDNSAEMIASFLSSLNHPGWNRIMLIRHNPIFKEKYIVLMNDFRNALTKNPELSNSPIKKLLDERIAYIELLRWMSL